MPPPAPDFAALLAARPAFSMHAQDGLCFGGVPLNAIADKYGTPSWVYDAGTLRGRYRQLQAACAQQGLAPAIHYAVKANDHLAILNVLRGVGAGADVVSLGELRRAEKAGISPAEMVFSGVGKTQAEIAAALALGIGQINVESAAELDMVQAAAAATGCRARIALRMNPDVDAGTHEKITTGRADNKFGIPASDILALYRDAAARPGIIPVGLALHIGSQIVSPAPYVLAYRRAAALVGQLRAADQKIAVLDLGGGLGIGHGDEPGLSLPAFAATVRREAGDLGVKLVLEPGRILAGPAGLLLASVILEKVAGARRFVVIDAAMNDLIRPALYDSWHGILPVSPVDFLCPTSFAEIVGPVCETADRFATARAMPPLRAGSRLAILDAGAYGAVMSSAYNARPRAAAVLIDQGVAHLITPRQNHEELWAAEIVP